MIMLVLFGCGENQIDDLTEHLAQCLACYSFIKKGGSYHYDPPCVIQGPPEKQNHTLNRLCVLLCV